MDQKVMDKIEKLLNLSKSSNEHESAVALSKAQKLMEMHNLSMTDLNDSAMGEELVEEFNFAKKLPRHVSLLLNMMSDTFSVAALLRERTVTSGSGENMRIYNRLFPCFVGEAAATAIASYTFTVLYRQMVTAKNKFVKDNCKGYMHGEKIRAGESFCIGWLYPVKEKVRIMSGHKERLDTANDYLDRTHGELDKASTKPKEEDVSVRDHALSQLALAHGFDNGEGVSLHCPMDGKESVKLGNK